MKKVRYPAAAAGAARLEVNYEYDAVGNLTKSYDTAGHVTEYGYDGGGRVVKTNDPENNMTRAYYDAHDNMSVAIDAAGNFYEYRYDYNDRLKKIVRNGGVRERTYKRDYSGNVTEMSKRPANPY